MSETLTASEDVAAIAAAAQHLASLAITNPPAAPAVAADVVHRVVVQANGVTQALHYLGEKGVASSLVLDVGNPVLIGFHAALAEWWTNLEGAAADYAAKLKLAAQK